MVEVAQTIDMDRIIGFYPNEIPEKSWRRIQEQINTSIVRYNLGSKKLCVEDIFDLDLHGKTIGDLVNNPDDALKNQDARSLYHEFRARLFKLTKSPTLDSANMSFQDSGLRAFTLMIIANELEPALGLRKDEKIYATTPFFQTITNSRSTTSRTLKDLSEPKNRSKHTQIMHKYRVGTDNPNLSGTVKYTLTTENASQFYNTLIKTSKELQKGKFALLIDYYTKWLKHNIENIFDLDVVEGTPLCITSRHGGQYTVQTHHIYGSANQTKVLEYYSTIINKKLNNLGDKAFLDKEN